MSSFIPKAAVGLAACAAMAVSMGILCPANALWAAGPVIEYRDVGGPQDFDTKQNIYFDHGEGFGGTGWPRLLEHGLGRGRHGRRVVRERRALLVGLRTAQGCEERHCLAGHQAPPLRPLPRQGRHAAQAGRPVPHAAIQGRRPGPGARLRMERRDPVDTAGRDRREERPLLEDQPAPRAGCRSPG